MRREILIGAIIVFAVLFVALIAHAEDAALSEGDESSETIKNEIRIMEGSYLGAQIRFLQLERAIKVRVYMANIVIDVLKANGKDTATLEGIVEELNALADEADVWSERAKNETNKTIMIEAYYDIRHDAYELMKEFRENVRTNGNLTSEEKAILVERFKTAKDQSQEIKDQIQEMKKEIMAENIRELYLSFGEEGDEIAEKIKSGELTMGQAIAQLQEKYRAKNAVERENIRAKIQNDIESQLSASADVIAQIKTAQVARASARMEQRAAILEAKANARAAGIVARNAAILRARVAAMEQRARIANSQMGAVQ